MRIIMTVKEDKEFWMPIKVLLMAVIGKISGPDPDDPDNW